MTSQSGSGSKKIGRDKIKGQRYRTKDKREANKVRIAGSEDALAKQREVSAKARTTLFGWRKRAYERMLQERAAGSFTLPKRSKHNRPRGRNGT